MQYDKSGTMLCFVIPAAAAAVIVIALIVEWVERREREERRRLLTSAWMRALDDLYPRRDLTTFPTNIRDLGSTELEHLCAHVYSHLGYQSKHHGGAGDEGVDVFLKQNGTIVAAVQCKQYSGPVPPKDVRELNGARHRYKGILWAPGGYTNAASSWAREHYPNELELLDEQGIMALIVRAYGEDVPVVSTISAPVIDQRPASPLPGGKFINPQALAAMDFGTVNSEPAAAPADDPLNLSSLIENGAKRLGLTQTQIYILVAILLVGIMLTTIMAVFVVAMQR